MTISTTTSRQSYNGNGVTTVFTVPFRFFQNSDLVVQLVTASTGASTTLTLGTHYTVTGADAEAGGSVTMVTAPAVGQTLVIRRVIAATQEVDYVAGDPFPAETHERALDRLTMLAQQGEESDQRTLKFPDTENIDGTLPPVALRSNKLAGYSSDGSPTALNLTLADDPLQLTEQLRGDLLASTGAERIGAGAGRTVRQRLDSLPAEVSATVTAEADRAEAARDAALIQAGVYATESAGRAAVVDGQSFKVQGSGDVAAYEYRRVNSTTSTLIATYPAAAAVTAISEQIGDGFSVADRVSPFAQHTIDSTGKVLGGIGPDARIYQGTTRGLWPLPDADWTNPVGDGRPEYDAIGQSYPTAVFPAMPWRVQDDWASVLYIIPMFGQSLAGAANDNDPDTIFNPTPTYPSQVLMPAPGLKPDFADFDTLVPMYERPGTGYDSHWETPFSTMMNGLVDDLLTYTGAQPKFCGFMASRGARSWPQIGPGNQAWASLTKGLHNCVRAARAMGLRPVVPAIMYVQGENDRGVGLTRSLIGRYRIQLAREIKTLVRSLTHQKNDPVIFISQPNNGVATDGLEPPHMLATLDVHGVDGICALPPHYGYTMPVSVHPTSADYVTMGQYFRRAVLNECFGPGFEPLRVVKARRVSATEIDLYYSVTAGPIQILTAGPVTPPTWAGSLYGFQFFDSNGSTSISSVVVRTDSDTVTASGLHQSILRITLASTPTGYSPRIHYATRSDGTGALSGNLTGPRGCVFDSATPAMPANSQVIYL